MTKVYHKLDEEKLAVIETIEHTYIVKKAALEIEKVELISVKNARIVEIDGQLAEFNK